MNAPLPDLPLRDIHLPESISWWPLSAGWWILFTLILAIFIAVLSLWRSYLKSSLKKEASKELSRIEKRFRETQEAALCLSDLSVLLRRIILSRHHRIKTAGITGIAWLKLLDKHFGSKEFSEGPGQLLLTGPYRLVDPEKSDVDRLIKLCRKGVNRL